MRKIPTLQLDGLTDSVLRKSLESLRAYLEAERQVQGFEAYELVFEEAQSERALTHTLGIVPLDVLVTHLSGAGTVTFLYAQFTDTQIVVSASAACRVRFLLGSCQMIPSSTQTKAADQQQFSASV